MRQSFAVPLCCCLLGYFPLIHAEAVIDDEAVVVSASRLPQSVSQVGSSVVVLSADELLERDVKFVADALQEVPSLLVSSQGPRGSQTKVRIRGNEANHVLVLIDGVRVSNASDGEYDLANLPLDGIETIEILLGPQSTLYGSDAAAGVISITTKRGEGTTSRRIRMAGGSLGTRSGSVHVGGSREQWHYAVTGSGYTTEGVSAADEDNGNDETDGYSTRSFNLKTGFQNERVDSTVVFADNRSRYEFDSTDFVSGEAIDDPDAVQWVDTRQLGWVTGFDTADSRLHHQLRLDKAEYDYKSATSSDYVTHTDRRTVGYQGDFTVNASHAIAFGVERVVEELSIDSNDAFFPLDSDTDVTNTGVYLQWLADIDGADISVGARNDRHEEFGPHTTYRLTISRALNTQWRIRSAYGTGFKAPGLIDLYVPEFGGNPDLEPEESSSFEVGVEYRDARHSASVTVFRQFTDNLIRYINTQVENVDSANSLGVELNAGVEFELWALSAGLTWLDSTEKQDGETDERLRVPEWSANIDADYFAAWGRLWAQALYRSQRRDQIFSFPVQETQLQAYWLINVGTSYMLTPQLTLSARIDNLADQDYEEVYSYGAPGRTALATVDWQF